MGLLLTVQTHGWLRLVWEGAGSLDRLYSTFMGRSGACSAGLTARDWNGTDTESTGPGSCRITRHAAEGFAL